MEILPYLQERILQKGHAVVVVAEGVGHEDHQPLMPPQDTHDYDASGNPRFKDIGLFIKGHLINQFKEINQDIQLKYIDNIIFIIR